MSRASTKGGEPHAFAYKFPYNTDCCFHCGRDIFAPEHQATPGTKGVERHAFVGHVGFGDEPELPCHVGLCHKRDCGKPESDPIHQPAQEPPSVDVRKNKPLAPPAPEAMTVSELARDVKERGILLLQRCQAAEALAADLQAKLDAARAAWDAAGAERDDLQAQVAGLEKDREKAWGDQIGAEEAMKEARDERDVLRAQLDAARGLLESTHACATLDYLTGKCHGCPVSAFLAQPSQRREPYPGEIDAEMARQHAEAQPSQPTAQAMRHIYGCSRDGDDRIGYCEECNQAHIAEVFASREPAPAAAPAPPREAVAYAEGFNAGLRHAKTEGPQPDPPPGAPQGEER